MVQDLERRLYGEELWVHGLWCGGETWGRCNTLVKSAMAREVARR